MKRNVCFNAISRHICLNLKVKVLPSQSIDLWQRLRHPLWALMYLLQSYMLS
jgi:hypothetical protein